ncbi:MAG: type IX secretion system sortase PorU, partial [Muribaculaceae bacterium]|nr:type IX secretion system sortase PorU [Muribaculaceae bacterium]
VYVYGYGGRMISEILSPDLPDDLPNVPALKKNDGSLTFYAVGNIYPTSSSTSMSFGHVINPYGDTSFYFLSDVPPTEEAASIDLSDHQGLSSANSFISQLVHEQDLLQCASSGRDYFGEDFKQNKSQEFDFSLPDNVSGNAKIRIRFAANVSGKSPSSILVSANGKRLAATNNDNISVVTSGDQFYNFATSTKTAEGVGNSLTVGIEFKSSGVVTTARLDWIEVEYERTLTIRNDELYFQVNPLAPTAYVISGATEETIIWDVTQPWNIKEVKGDFNPSAKTLTIGVKEKGLREFFAFNPSAKGATIPGRYQVANQNIHGLPTPDMVIISPDELSAAAEKIANLHRNHDNMTVHVLSPEKIYNEFSSGNADLSAFRKLLKMWYDRSLADPDGSQFGYCLLMGRPTYDQKFKNPETKNAGYTHTLIWQTPTGTSESSSYCTDDFITMLEDETTSSTIALRTQNIGVGRYPVTSAYEANIIADKLEAYMTNPIYGSWRNNVMVIADDDDSAVHLEQAESSVKNMMKNYAGQHVAYDKVYLDAFDRKETGSGYTFPAAKDHMLMKWQKEGVALINYIGHANPKEWAKEKILNWNDITGMSNQYLPILYAATCSFGKWDAEEISGAEIMLNNPAGGFIAAITPSRTVLISKNSYITNSISEEFFRRDPSGRGQRLGDIVRLGKNKSFSRDDNMLRYHLFGDPALRMPVSTYNIVIDSIAGLPVVNDVADAPTVKARSSLKITGRVTDASGETVAFNGPVQFTLFDSEKSVETNGWGETGKVSHYQDRSSKLATAACMATNGEWEATIMMPSEIANNYSPAFITGYGYDNTLKVEASGSTDKLFVYGYNEDAAEDTDGPEILLFGVNSLSANGTQTVNPNPVALAEFCDQSGINISEAGIGHKMRLLLDKDKLYDDVSKYFTPDPEDNTKGSISYPLIDLEPGDHELTLTVWDNANNSTSATLNFKVGLNLRPDVTEISTYYDRNSDRLNLKVSTDRPLCTLTCRLECYDLGGQLKWQTQRKVYSGNDSSFNYSWDLKDINGNRLKRGIYLLRTVIESEDGLSSSESKKIAIPAK